MEISGRIGKFNILRKLGSGGFGTVYLAEDAGSKTESGSVYMALKIPHRIGVDLKKLKQEFILQYKLNNHPNIVKLHSAGTSGAGCAISIIVLPASNGKCC